MMRQPQRYASTVASLIERELSAPVLVVTPYGLGVAGSGIRNGVRRPVTASEARRLVGGLEVTRDAQGDELARVAMAAVRRIARAGGHRLPAHVPPAEPATPAVPPGPVETAASSRAAGGGGGGALVWIVAAGAFALALVAARARPRASAGRGTRYSDGTAPPGRAARAGGPGSDG
jgi:hypothetical protein